MGFYIISYVNSEISINYCDCIEELRDNFHYGVDDKTLLLEFREKKCPIKITDIENYENVLENCQLGFIAEKFFRDACLKSSLITIKVEQSKESYIFYKSIFEGRYIKRPDYYILNKDIFVEVKARSKEACKGYFFSILKEDLEAYRLFQEYSLKKLLFAIYRISETRTVLEETLAMIALDDINIKNKYVYEKENFYVIDEKAFVKGLDKILNMRLKKSRSKRFK